MGLRKAKGNTYSDCNFLWSPLTGGCLHQCSYCYAAKNQIRYGKWWQDKPHWASENFKKIKGTDPIWVGLPKLPEGRIFVCDTTDLFADNISTDWIETILNHCWQQWCYNANHSYVIQTKNPKRLMEFNYIFERFPNDVLRFGITLETNRDMSAISKATSPYYRMIAFRDFITATQYESFVTIEPIMQFDLEEFIGWFQQFTPDLIWIGADSHKSNLQEPTAKEIKLLIKQLGEITDLRLKDNLYRLLPISTSELIDDTILIVK